MRILLVEDEEKLAESLRKSLSAEQYSVSLAHTGEDGFQQAITESFDLLILDVLLPGRDGLQILKELRHRGLQLPVLILSAKDGQQDRVRGLDAGADDFVTKPFSSGELLARLRTTLRRGQPQRVDAIFCTGNLEVDLSARLVLKNGQAVKLTPTEYALLRLLIVHVGRILTHRQLLTEVWGPNAVEQTQYLRVHIAHLREKLEDNAAQPKFIITEPAVGYRAVRLE